MRLYTKGRDQQIRESYRHPVTGSSTNRVVFRWPHGCTLLEHANMLGAQRAELVKQVAERPTKAKIRGIERLNRELDKLHFAAEGLKSPPRRAIKVITSSDIDEQFAGHPLAVYLTFLCSPHAPGQVTVAAKQLVQLLQMAAGRAEVPKLMITTIATKPPASTKTRPPPPPVVILDMNPQQDAEPQP